MQITVLGLMDLVGTIAFAISGALLGIHKKMDIFGINILYGWFFYNHRVGGRC